MPSREFHAFCWLDEERKLAYAFWGRAGEPDRLWRFRFDFGSELNEWLLILPAQPKLHPDISFNSLWPGFGTQARTVVRAISKRLKNEGYRLLSSRDRATINAGKKAKRPVYVEVQGRRQWFKSVSSAARSLGIDKSSITLAAQNLNRLDVWYDEPRSKA